MARSTRSSGTRAPIRGYDNWTTSEMQKKLGRRSPDELEALLDYEKATKNRKGAIDAIKRAVAHASEGGKSRTSGRSGRKSASRSTKSRGRSSKKDETPVGKTGARGRVSDLVESIQRRVSKAIGSAPTGTFDRQTLMDRLSEFLEHEHGGAKLYELGLEKVENEEQRERIQEFLDQTHRHEEILTGMIQELGGHPDSLSESAELDRQKSEALLEADAEGEVGLLNFFQNLFMAELSCHMNWEFLAKVLRYVDDAEVRAVLEPHVSGVEDEEDEHVNWARKQLEECSLKMVFRAEEESSSIEEEQPSAEATPGTDESEDESDVESGDEDMGDSDAA